MLSFECFLFVWLIFLFLFLFLRIFQNTENDFHNLNHSLSTSNAFFHKNLSIKHCDMDVLFKFNLLFNLHVSFGFVLAIRPLAHHQLATCEIYRCFPDSQGGRNLLFRLEVASIIFLAIALYSPFIQADVGAFCRLSTCTLRTFSSIEQNNE